MKLYRITEATGIEALALQEGAQPEPRAGEILVRMRAFSLNYRDLMIVQGRYPGHVSTPLVPLSDGAGEVVAVGDGVTRFSPGDRVASCFFGDWLDGALTTQQAGTARGGAAQGVLSEYAVLEERGAVRLPDHLSFEEGATLPCAALTAWHALVPYGRIATGETVLVQGTGGVSLFALQFARGLGAHVIATSSSDEKLERLRALGVEGTINYRSTPEWQDEVRRLTDKTGVDLVVEVGGSGTLGRSMQAARTGGKIAVIGVLTGANEVDPVAILGRRLSLQGIMVGSTTMFEAMNRAIEATTLRPVIDRVFGFDEVQAAYRHLESGRHFGKVVISVP